MRRMVKKGKVKINGNWYAPRQVPHYDLPYDGRLDNTQQLFGAYPEEGRFVALLHAPIIDGIVEWTFWERCT